MNRALAFAIVGIIYAIVAALLFGPGPVARWRGLTLYRTRPSGTFKEDAAWAKAQRS